MTPDSEASASSTPGSAAVDPTQVARTLESWLAREREIRLFTRPPAPISPDDMARQGGLDFLLRIARGELPGIPIAQTLDFVPVEWETGRIVFQGSPRFEFYNPIGTVHGGYLATLLDSAMGCAVHSTLAPGIGYTTLELKLNYVRPLTDKVGPIRAEGKVISVTRRVGTAEGRAYDAAGRLYAHGTTTCLIFPIDEAQARRAEGHGTQGPAPAAGSA